MEMVVLYLEGCPNRELAESRAQLAFERVGASGKVRSKRIESAADAKLLGFRGSPTLLLDVVDVFAEESSPYGVACRLYRNENGLEGSPSLDDLMRAIARSERVADDD
ncbi:hypothetical protein BH23ACT12_BH23ACT12_06400 [soil metagenome]